jgi:hypothetical protein
MMPTYDVYVAMTTSEKNKSQDIQCSILVLTILSCLEFFLRGCFYWSNQLYEFIQSQTRDV